MKDANCIGIDPEVFFSDPGKKMYQDVRLLTQTCNNCGVFNDCKEYALRYSMSGWWANTTENSREKEQKLRGITPIRIVKESA